ncbi:hypothetical protein PV326_009992 [Microctonus aethiopoides]|nr:hypothetical protein PV326_009992 [Microctonus aethiopoides]
MTEPCRKFYPDFGTGLGFSVRPVLASISVIEGKRILLHSKLDISGTKGRAVDHTGTATSKNFSMKDLKTRIFKLENLFFESRDTVVSRAKFTAKRGNTYRVSLCGNSNFKRPI